MDHQKKLDFVLKMTKHALEHVQHFDGGGVVGDIGGAIQGVAGDFTAKNGYQANIAPTNQIDYSAPAKAAVGNIGQGYGQSQKLLNEQQGLAGTLANEVQGGGPNPAQAQLNQATGQNIEQQAALAAGTRGAGANAGLIASNNARQGAAIQQNAVGQAATMRAQQQLAAQGQLQQQQNSELGNIQGEQGIQGNLYGASANANNAQNNTAVSNYGMAQGINAGVAQNNANAVNQTNKGFLSGIGAAIPTVGGAVGGAVRDAVGSLASVFAEGGKVEPHMHHAAKIFYPHLYAEGGNVDFGVSSSSAPSVSTPSLIVPQSNDSENKASGSGGPGGSAQAAMMFAAKGGKIPGKAKVDHDDYANDTVDAQLSPGEVVIDLNTLKDKGKLGKMARFVAANIERKKMGRKA